MVALWLLAFVLISFAAVVFLGAPYVPTHRRNVRRLLKEAPMRFTKNDVVLDIGSGDGVVLRQFASKVKRAVGYEIHPVLVVVSKLLSRKDPNISIRLANFWRAEFPDDVTVVYAFAESRDIDKIAARIQSEATRLHRTLTFISYGFKLKEFTEITTVAGFSIYKLDPLQTGEA